jgi:hypothetical protein
MSGTTINFGFQFANNYKTILQGNTKLHYDVPRYTVQATYLRKLVYQLDTFPRFLFIKPILRNGIKLCQCYLMGARQTVLQSDELRHQLNTHAILIVTSQHCSGLLLIYDRVLLVRISYMLP